jgi:predicted ATP-grasp superfamily ATP-dependent carboligase
MTATGLAIARSLGRRGVPVYGVDGHKFEIGHKSKYVLPSAISFTEYKDTRLADKLILFAKEDLKKKPVLYIAGDEYLSALIDHLPALSQYYIMPSCYRLGHVKQYLDKETFYNKCKHHNLDIPVTLCSENSSYDEISQNLRFPIILKPTLGHEWKSILGSKKVFIIHNAEQLNRLFCDIGDKRNRLIIQELIPGNDQSIYQLSVYIDDSGVPLEIMCSRKIRQHPNNFGIGSLIKTIWLEELVDRALKDLAKLNFRGICDIEYKLDQRTRCWKLIEINPRVGMYFALCESAGCNLIWNSYCNLIDRSDLKENSHRQKEDFTWQYLARDIPAFFKKILNRDIKNQEFINFLNFRDKIEPVLSFQDFGCTIYYPFYIVKKFFQF